MLINKDLQQKDERWMRYALQLGRRNLGQTWPNPSVGCVIVKNNRLIATGCTQAHGRPHAEVVALKKAGDAAKGAIAYITLEPCAHFGRTPPCTDALIEANISRVVYAVDDPDPRVCNQGAMRLKKAGVDVTSGILREEAHDAHSGFFMRVQHGRPKVTLKLATSLDGKIATHNGESKWITKPLARKYVHFIRAEHDAILVGRGTAEADNPKLDVRLSDYKGKQPFAILADSQLSLAPSSHLYKMAEKRGLWVFHNKKEIDDKPSVTFIKCDMSPNAMLLALGERGITRLLLEGGGRIAASFLESDKVDEILLFQSGRVLGASGRPSIGALFYDKLRDFPQFTLKNEQKFEDDILLTYQRQSEE